MSRLAGALLVPMITVILAVWFLTPAYVRGDLASPAWWDPDGVSTGYDWHYRVAVHIPSGSVGDSVRVAVDFGSLLSSLGVSGDFDENSVRVINTANAPVSAQKFDDTSYQGTPDDPDNGKGDVEFVLEDPAPVTYYIYFDIVENGPKPAPSFSSPTPIQLLGDESFEGSPPGTESPVPWVGGGVDHPYAAHEVVTGNDPHLGGSVAYSGSQSYKIGWDYSGSGPSSASGTMGGWVYQEVTIPSTGATLSFCRRMVSYDYSPYDRFRAQIRSTSNSILETLLEETAPSGGSGWKERPWKCFSYDLSAYAGQTIRIYFEAGNTADNLFGTYAYVDDVKLLSWLPATLGDPEGFGVDVVSVTNYDNPGQPLRCGVTALVEARSDVGQYLDDGSGDELRGEVRDSLNGIVASITLRDDGMPPDDVAHDGVFHGTFPITGPLDERGGTWTVRVWAGEPPDYDNGYSAVDTAQFVVEGLDATPEHVSATVVKGTPLDITIHVTNIGSADATHVKLMIDPTGGIDPSYVTFSANDFTLAPGASTDVVMTVNVPVTDPTGTFSSTIWVFSDEDNNGVPDDCLMDSLAFDLTIQAPALYVLPNPVSTSVTVEPSCSTERTRVYYVVNYENIGANDDEYMISLASPDSDWNISVYKDVLGDDTPGFYTVQPASMSDDVLLAFDTDGDTSSGWTYVNPATDTHSDGIPDTGVVPSGSSVTLVFVIDMVTEEMNAGDHFAFSFRAGSYTDWQTNHPAAQYYDDVVLHADSYLTTTISETPCGFISPDEGSVSVAPLSDTIVSFSSKWVNVAPMTDRGNVKIMSNTGGFRASLYLDQGRNDPLGAFDHSIIDGDDVLLARDDDGDGSWDYVNPAYDTGADGIPDTGDLTSHGGYSILVLVLDIPRRSAPGTFEVTLRGSSNYDWQTNHPTDPYYSDAVFHDETRLEVEITQVNQPDISVTFPNGTTFWDDLYDPTGVLQAATVTQKASEVKSYVVRVENDGNVPDTYTFRVLAPGSVSHTSVMDGAVNVTDDAITSGYSIFLNPGESKDLVVSVRPDISRDGVLLTYFVDAISSNDPSVQEMVTGRVSVVDDVPPLVYLSSPEDGSTTTEGNVTFVASIHDDTGVNNATIRVYKGNTLIYEDTKQGNGSRDVFLSWSLYLTKGPYKWQVSACDIAVGRQNCIDSTNYSLGVEVPVSPVGRAPPLVPPPSSLARYSAAPFKLYTYFSPPSADVGEEVEVYVLLKGRLPVGGQLTYRLPYGLEYVKGSSVIDGRSVEPIERDRELIWNVEPGSRVIRFKVRVLRAAHGTLWGEAWILDAVGTSPLVVGRSLPSISPPESVGEVPLVPTGSEISAKVLLNPTLARVGDPVRVVVDLRGEGRVPISLQVSEGLHLTNSTADEEVDLPAKVSYEVIPSRPGTELVTISVGNETVSIPLPVIEAREGALTVTEIETETVTETERVTLTVTRERPTTQAFSWEWIVVAALAVVFTLLLVFDRRRPPFHS